MKRLILYFCSAIICFALMMTNGVVAQDVYLSVHHDVYPFLKRMEARQLLTNYRDAAKPFSRKVIASYLDGLRTSVENMTTVERETYEFLCQEFAYEFSVLESPYDSTTARRHLLSLPVHGGMMYIDPDLELSGKTSDRGDVYTWSYGLQTYGYLLEGMGYYFNFTLHREGGTAQDRLKQLTPETGVVIQRGRPQFFEYNSTEAQVTFGWKDLRFSLEKMHNVWGLGRRGSLIFSDKAPSYPQFKLRIPISDWMDFIYVHGDLHSNVIDSARSYQANSSQLRDFYRTVYRSKYLAAHQIEVTPFDGLDLSLGESIVYSDKNPQLIYLIPIMLFKSAEHYNRDTDNAQIFASVDVNVIRNTNFYLSVFIDEINTEKLFDSTESRNQAGFTAGVQLYDVGIENAELLLEYTRLNPWTYTHKFPAATFTNNGYDLGHWVGQNSDNLYAELTYWFSYDLRASAFFERIRNGALRDLSAQYTPPSEPFLYGPVRRATSFGFTGEYQFIRDGFLHGSLRWNSVSNEANPSEDRNNQIEIFLGAKYGL